MIKERKVMKKEVEENLINIVVEFAVKQGLTVLNIKEVMEKVYEDFEGNAVIEKAAEI